MGKVRVGEMRVGEMRVDKMRVGKMRVGKMRGTHHTMHMSNIIDMTLHPDEHTFCPQNTSSVMLLHTTSYKQAMHKYMYLLEYLPRCYIYIRKSYAVGPVVCTY